MIITSPVHNEHEIGHCLIGGSSQFSGPYLGITTVTSADNFIGLDIVQRPGASTGSHAGFITVSALERYQS